MILRLKSLCIARASVKNWLEVSKKLRMASRYPLELQDNTRVIFKNGHDIDISHLSTVWGIINYYFYSRKMGIFSDLDLELLSKLGDTINFEIDRNIQKRDFKLHFQAKDGIIYAIVRKFKPKLIVETGVAYGISSAVFLQAIKSNNLGKLISIDLPNRDPGGFRYENGTLDAIFLPKNLEPGWVVPKELRENWVLKLGKSSEKLKEINETIDLFFHDSEHSFENMMQEFRWAFEHLSIGGILGSDDVTWNSSYSNFVKSHAMTPLIEGNSIPSFYRRD